MEHKNHRQIIGVAKLHNYFNNQVNFQIIIFILLFLAFLVVLSVRLAVQSAYSSAGGNPYTDSKGECVSQAGNG